MHFGAIYLGRRLINKSEEIYDYYISAFGYWRQLKDRSKGFGKNVVAGFIPARTANNAVVN